MKLTKNLDNSRTFSCNYGIVIDLRKFLIISGGSVRVPVWCHE